MECTGCVRPGVWYGASLGIIQGDSKHHTTPRLGNKSTIWIMSGVSPHPHTALECTDMDYS
jgi:hypothetical protein